jgi:hypothetical protein
MRHLPRMTNQRTHDEPMPGAMAGGAPGPQAWLPDEASTRPTSSAPLSGKLATSGPDDQARGDTVTGLGFEDVDHPTSRSAAAHAPAAAPSEQSGAPTPGNRYPEADRG